MRQPQVYSKTFQNWPNTGMLDSISPALANGYKAPPRHLMTQISRLAGAVAFMLLFGVSEVFRRSPRPSSSPLVSGIGPLGGQDPRLLSGDQLNRLEAWLRLHQEGWRRNIIPPTNCSYMVQVEHSDGTTTFLFLFSRMQSSICFEKHTKTRRVDVGWLSLPVAEVDDLITMLRNEA